MEARTDYVPIRIFGCLAATTATLKPSPNPSDLTETKNALFAPYLKTVDIYKCPADRILLARRR